MKMMIADKKLNDRSIMLKRTIKKLGFDDFDDESFTKVSEDFLNRQNTELVTFTSTDIDSPLNDSFFIIFYDYLKNSNISKIKKELEKKLKKDKFFKNSNLDKNNLNIKIIEIFESKHSKNKINRSKVAISDLRKSVQDFIHEKTNDGQTYSLRNIDYFDYFLPIEEMPPEITIRIDNRIRSIENLSRDEINLTSYVFTANVNDLINLYNIMGDSLFSKNVRVGDVKDNIDVGPAIQETYKKYPDEFWHLNNGISLLIQGEEPIDLSVFDRMKINTAPIKKISVINGAQTLTALSDTKFTVNEEDIKKAMTKEERDKLTGNAVKQKVKEKNKELAKQKEKAKDNASVLLRVYSIVNTKTEVIDNNKKNKQRELIEKITLSLNRQKPIIQADISYMTNFVENISLIHHLEEDKLDQKGFTFNFIRSGEEGSTALQEYSLGIFAKIVKSYLLGKPGEARTNAYATLLKTEYVSAETDTHKLKVEEIFKEKIQEKLLSDSENPKKKLEYFHKKYRPVNFAMDMKDKLEEKNIFMDLVEEYINEFEDDSDSAFKDNLKTFAKYGVLLIISLYINLENERLDDDYHKNRSKGDSYLQYDSKDFSKWKYRKISNFTEGDPSDMNEDILRYSEWKDKVSDLIGVFAVYLKRKTNNDTAPSTDGSVSETDDSRLESNHYKNDELSIDLYKIAKERNSRNRNH